MSDPISIPDAALKHGVDVKRLRGVVWRENMTGDLDLPIGCMQSDLVYDDDRLRDWVKTQ
jgi:hypothetical protein